MSTEQILRIALAHLCESPFNPRLTFTSIDELADNLKAEGRIHQPLLVRPLLGNRPGTPPPWTCSSPPTPLPPHLRLARARDQSPRDPSGRATRQGPATSTPRLT